MCARSQATAQQGLSGRNNEQPDANCRFVLLQRYVEYFFPIVQHGKRLCTTAAQCEKVLAALKKAKARTLALTPNLAL